MDDDLIKLTNGEGAVPRACVEAVNAFYNSPLPGTSREDIHAHLVAVVLDAYREHEKTQLREPPDTAWLGPEIGIVDSVVRFQRVKHWLGWVGSGAL